MHQHAAAPDRRCPRRALLASLGAAAVLAGCGFALRQTPALRFQRIALLGFDARSPLATALRARLADAQSGTLAESERHLKRLMERAGLRGWVFNAEIRSATDELLGVGDCVHFTLRIVVEVDGWAWHTDRQRFQRDRDRQNALVHAGWMVLRFTWLDLIDHPDRVIASIRRAITQANATSI